MTQFKKYEDRDTCIFDTERSCWIPKDLGNVDYVNYLEDTGLMTKGLRQQISKLKRAERASNRSYLWWLGCSLMFFGVVLIIIGLSGI